MDMRKFSAAGIKEPYYNNAFRDKSAGELPRLHIQARDRFAQRPIQRVLLLLRYGPPTRMPSRKVRQETEETIKQ